jgi:hypothetical protein
MRGHGRTTAGVVRLVGAVLGTVGLLTAAVGGPPVGAAEAAAPADPVASVAAPIDDMLSLPENATYALSPQLARMLGVTTLDGGALRGLRAAARPGLPGERTPPVGTTLLWPAMDISDSALIPIYLKPYTLRAVGEKIEVWVASGQDGVSAGTAFPAGDCRNDVPNSTAVTDAQVRDLVRQFDRNMYPKETATLSTPPDRAGVNTLPGLTAAGLNFAGDGDHTVTLVDNVRDPNFYAFPQNKSYVAGFYAPIFNQLTDRNVMTIDAFDWLHRTGAEPANEPSADLCKSRPARPFAYEGVFAHEWQHLLQQYQDPRELPWVNEGLSDFAISLTRYGDAARGVKEKAAQAHVYCFQGYGTVRGPANPNPNPCGGPQNSLTTWGDEGSGSEILADYGNAWSFMLFLYDRYGAAFMSALHRDSAHQGLASVQAQLDTFANGTKVADVLHDYQLMNLVDHEVDMRAGTVSGIAKSRVTSRSLDASVNLANPTSYLKPGAAPNGADYVLLKENGRMLRSVGFRGDRTVLSASSDAGSVPVAESKDRAGASVHNWFVSLVGIDKARHRVLVASRDGAFSASWTARQLAVFKAYPMVVAVIAHDDPDELDGIGGDYAGYSFEVNGRRSGG